MTIEITYTYCDSCTSKSATWEGDPADALRAAVDHLNADQDPDDEDSWIYYASETNSRYRVDADDMRKAGAAILDGRSDWYSIWCADTSSELVGSGRE